MGVSLTFAALLVGGRRKRAKSPDSIIIKEWSNEWQPTNQKAFTG